MEQPSCCPRLVLDYLEVSNNGYYAYLALASLFIHFYYLAYPCDEEKARESREIQNSDWAMVLRVHLHMVMCSIRSLSNIWPRSLRLLVISIPRGVNIHQRRKLDFQIHDIAWNYLVVTQTLDFN